MNERLNHAREYDKAPKIPLSEAAQWITDGKYRTFVKNSDRYAWDPREVKRLLDSQKSDLPSAYIIRLREKLGTEQRIRSALLMMKCGKSRPLLLQLDTFFDEGEFFNFKNHLEAASQDMPSNINQIMHESIQRHRFINVYRLLELQDSLWPFNQTESLNLLNTSAQRGCFLACEQIISCLDLVGIPIPQELRKSIQDAAEIEKERRKTRTAPMDHFYRYLEKRSDLMTDDFAEMYFNSHALAILKRIQNAIMKRNVSVKFKVQLLDIEADIKQTTDEMAAWFKILGLFMVCKEICSENENAPDTHADILFMGKTMESIRKDLFDKKGDMLTTTPTTEEVVEFLHEAQYRFKDEVFVPLEYPTEYGGEGWSLMACATQDLWLSQSSNPEERIGVMDRFADLQHNNGNFFKEIDPRLLEAKKHTASIDDLFEALQKIDEISEKTKKHLKQRMQALNRIIDSYRRLAETHRLPELQIQ